MEFGFGQSDSAPHAGTRSVGVELLEYVQEQDGCPTETVSEAPGAYGGCGGGHAPRRVETPSPDGPADLEMFRPRTARPVRVPRDVSLPVLYSLTEGTLGTQLAFASMHFPQ